MKSAGIFAALAAFIVIVCGCAPAEPKQMGVLRLPEFGSSVPPEAPPGSYSGVYIADKYDTVLRVSKRFNIPVGEIMKLNKLTSTGLKEGQAILIPRKKSSARRMAEVKSEAKFIKPVNGRIITRFGDDLGGLTANYITIKARYGTMVKAAKSGVVSRRYQGTPEGKPGMRGLEGFGNFLMLFHGDGEYTMYGHLAKVLKKRGAFVKQGEIIGTVGASGRIKEPALRFQIFKKGMPVDPLPLLP